MRAGRELDVLVAEHVFGFHREVDMTHDYDHVQHKNEVLVPPGQTLEGLREWLPRKGQIPFGYFVTERYSTDIAAAWRVVDRLRLTGQGIVIKAYPEGRGLSFVYTAHVPETDAQGAGATAPHAICLAALKAAGWKESSDEGR